MTKLQVQKGSYKNAKETMLYKENPKDATRKVLELNEFGKVAVYKINAQKCLAFLYNNN